MGIFPRKDLATRRYRQRKDVAAGIAMATLIAAAVLAPPDASATPVVNGPFEQLYNVGINNLGFYSGSGLRIGARVSSAAGSPDLGDIASSITASATTTNIATGQQFTRSLNFVGSPAIGGLFTAVTNYSPNLAGPWTLNFSDGVGAATTLTTPAIPQGAQPVPFVQSITLSGTSLNPTFSWAPPPNTTVNGYRINIYDQAERGRTNADGQVINATGQIFSRDFGPSVTSFTVANGAPGLQSGYSFNQTSKYAIEISLLQTRDGSTNTSNANVYAMSRVYADFQISNTAGPQVNLPLSKLNPSDPYSFNMAVQPNTLYYIDPEVATGYEYAIGAGNPNFASVLLPALQSDPYRLTYAYGGKVFDEFLTASTEYFFPTGGVGAFTITGIKPELGLDPNNPTAFITGLTFAGPGQFTGTMTPITTTVEVPEPGSAALFAIGVIGVWRVRRRHSPPAGGAGAK